MLILHFVAIEPLLFTLPSCNKRLEVIIGQEHEEILPFCWIQTHAGLMWYKWVKSAKKVLKNLFYSDGYASLK